MSEVEFSPGSNELVNYYHKVDARPTDPTLWKEILMKAQIEERAGYSPSGLEGISCVNLEQIHGEILRATTSQDKFAVLAQKAPDGALWYDHVLGKTNRIDNAPLLKFINTQNYERVVDIGTGSGDSLINSTPNRQVIGLDLSEAFLRSVPKSQNATRIVANAARMPFEANSADCIYSVGLTRYLTKDDLKTFAAETARVLRPGGVYLENTNIQESGTIPQSEEHLTESYKSLLLLVLDRLVTAETEGSETSFNDWKTAFAKQGLQLRMDRIGNNVVFEFRKPYAERLEEALSSYTSGDANEANDYVEGFLYPQRFFQLKSNGLIQNEALTLTEWEQRVEEYGRFGKDERIVHAPEEADEYYFLCISHLLPVIEGKQYVPEYQPAAIKVLEQNVDILIRKKIDLNSSHWSHKADRDLLTRIQKAVSGNPQCASIIERIDEVLIGSETQ